MRRFFKVFALLSLLVAGAYGLWLGVPRHDYFIERVGIVDRVEHQATTEAEGIRERVRLASSTGLTVNLNVLRPAGGDDRRLPVLLLAGGHRTGRDAVDRVGRPDGVAFAAIDYPYTGNSSPEGLWQALGTAPHIQRAFLDTPPALSLAAAWLATQSWADATQIELVGASLGVPFAAVAGALDESFSRVWLLHGGVDNVSWVSHAGRKHIANETMRRLAARFALLLVHGPSFDTAKWIRETAPRPVVLVAARDDDYVPRESQAPLEELAKLDHVELLWTEGRHIGPGREKELGQLLDIVLSRVGR